ncbi:MAG: DUF362 domain-containing protein [Candidatus Latescibacterota bacterium]
MAPFRDEIEQGIRGKQVIIKVNCVSDGDPLCATPPDAIRAVIDFLKPLYSRQIIVAESTASAKGARYAFEQYGIAPIEKEYGVRLMDLNEQSTTHHWIMDQNFRPAKIRIINTFLDQKNYFFSVTRLKTHNRVVATMSLKNMVMASPLRIPAANINDKQLMHAGHTSPKTLHMNLFKIAHTVYPDFCVLDGFEGMEGSGPIGGEPVDHRVAVAGPDYVAVDRIGAELMGIPFGDIGYLTYCAQAGLGQGDRSKINIIGADPQNHVIKYKLHRNIAWQLSWKEALPWPTIPGDK